VLEETAMKSMKPTLAALVALAALALSASAATAQEAGQEAEGTNVLLTLTLGEINEGPTRTYRLVSRSNETSSLLIGWRTPIPTVREGADGDPITSYVYQNVGMTARLRPELLSNKRLRVRGEIEISGTREADMKENVEGMPIIGTFQLDLDVILQEGEALRVAEVPDPESGQRYLEITAQLLN
jgi:Flp pilus assembly secretin CpaC